MNFLIAFAFAFVVLTTTEAKSWYVSPLGSDVIGNGSMSNPFKTLQQAYNVAYYTGDTIYLDKGIYPGTITFLHRKSLSKCRLTQDSITLSLKSGYDDIDGKT